MACVSGWVSPLSLPGSTTEAAPKVLMSQYHASLRSLALPLLECVCMLYVYVCVCVVRSTVHGITLVWFLFPVAELGLNA